MAELELDEAQPGTAIAERPQVNDLLRQVLDAATNPAVDAGKMKELVALVNGQQDREAERRFRMAKHKALQAMPSITKSGAILNKQGLVQSRYAKFEDIHRVVTPILAEHNLIISFNVGHEGQMVTVQPILAYSDGELAYEERGGEMVLAIDTTGSKNATQGAGSAASYGKRHSLKAMLNIVEDAEDDDGQQGKGAGGYDSLPQERKGLIDQARQEALRGTESYGAWFKNLTPDERGFLAFNLTETGETWHDQNKRNAAQITAEA